ncbi:MAG: hypothetical protein AAGK67_18110 [Pseudomonadota bacterium]
MVKTINTKDVRLVAANDDVSDITAIIDLASTELPHSVTIIEAELVVIETHTTDIIEQLMADTANDNSVIETASVPAIKADPED